MLHESSHKDCKDCGQEQAINPVHVNFSHFEFPELKGESVGDEVMVVMRGFVTKVTGQKPEKNHFGEPMSTEVRFARSSVIHGKMSGEKKRLVKRLEDELEGKPSVKNRFALARSIANKRYT